MMPVKPSFSVLASFKPGEDIENPVSDVAYLEGSFGCFRKELTLVVQDDLVEVPHLFLATDSDVGLVLVVEPPIKSAGRSMRALQNLLRQIQHDGLRGVQSCYGLEEAEEVMSRRTFGGASKQSRMLRRKLRIVGLDTSVAFTSELREGNRVIRVIRQALKSHWTLLPFEKSRCDADAN